MKRAVAYARVSTDKEDQLNSLETQKEYFDDYANEKGMELVNIYADEGISGTKLKNRKEFQKMLLDAENQKFDTLLVKDVSRFARNTVDGLTSLRLLQDNDIEVMFINNMGIAGSNEFLITIYFAIAQQESENTSKRVKFGKKQNMKKGKVPNQVYGYDKTIGDFFNLEKNPQEAAVVQRIFDYYVNMGIGASAIARILNKEGIKTKRGKDWYQNTVTRILTNELYVGKIVNGKQEMKNIYSDKRKTIDEEEWIVTERPDLAIVEESLFYRAQDILHGRYDSFKINRTRQSNRHTFSNLLKCECCGYSFRKAQLRTKTPKHEWICSNRNYNGVEACPNVTKVDEAEMLEGIVEYLKSYYQNLDKMLQWTKNEFEILYKESLPDDNSLENLSQEIEQFKKKLEKLDMKFDRDIISIDEYEREAKALKARIVKLEYQLQDYRDTDKVTKQLDMLMKNLFSDIEKTLTADVITNELLKNIIDKIVVCEDGEIKVYMNGRRQRSLGSAKVRYIKMLPSGSFRSILHLRRRPAGCWTRTNPNGISGADLLPEKNICT